MMLATTSVVRCGLRSRLLQMSTRASSKLTCVSITERDPVAIPLPEKWEQDFLDLQEHMGSFQNIDYWGEMSKRETTSTLQRNKDSTGFDLNVPKSLVTPSDEKDNKHSQARKLTEPLILVVRKNESEPWQFPRTECNEGEKMKDAAARSLDEIVDKIDNIWFPGQAPCGHKADENGEKVFYYRNFLVNPAQKLRFNRRQVKDYAWVAKDELSEYLSPEEVDYVQHIV